MARFKKRGVMSEGEVKRRLISAYNEFDFALKSNKFIFMINDDFHTTVIHIHKLINESIADSEYQKKSNKLVISLQQEVKNLLSTLD